MPSTGLTFEQKLQAFQVAMQYCGAGAMFEAVSSAYQSILKELGY